MSPLQALLPGGVSDFLSLRRTNPPGHQDPGGQDRGRLHRHHDQARLGLVTQPPAQEPRHRIPRRPPPPSTPSENSLEPSDILWRICACPAPREPTAPRPTPPPPSPRKPANRPDRASSFILQTIERASTLLKKNDSIRKCPSVVDRKDLGRQPSFTKQMSNYHGADAAFMGGVAQHRLEPVSRTATIRTK